MTNSNENLESIPTIHLSTHHEIHLADALSLDDAKTPSEPSDADACTPSYHPESFRVPVTDVKPVKSSEATTYWAALASSWKRNRAALISATVQKENRNDKIGLCLKKDHSHGGGILMLSSIHPGGLFSQSPFEVGDWLVSINNISCQDMSASVAAQLLRNMTGTLTVVVQNATGDPQLVESMVCKPQRESKTGLSVISTGFSRARIFDINPQGIFANSLLNRKDLIISINDIPCQYLDSREAADIVASAEKCVTVIAERKHESAVVMAMTQ